MLPLRSEKSAEAIVAALARWRRAEHEEPKRRRTFEWTRDTQTGRATTRDRPGG